ncbi:hypothetical protein L195_g023199, partial [Trifolium pratense]
MSRTCYISQRCNDGGENNNLSQYQQPPSQVSASTDASFDNVVHDSAGSHE